MATKKTATKAPAKKATATKKSAPARKASSGTAASKASKTASSPAKKAAKKVSSKRELIAPNGDKRLIRRDAKGRIKESDDLGASLSQDVRKASRTVVESGQGDRGDQKKPAARKSM